MKAYPADRHGERFCSGCQAWVPVKLFNGVVARGKQYLRRVCQACQRTYGTAWWQKNRKGNPRAGGRPGFRRYMKEESMETAVAEEADFKILKIVKHPSKPVLWSVMIKLPDGAIHSVQIDTKGLLGFGKFQKAFFEKVFVMLPDVPWRAWRKMIASCKILDLSKYPTRKAD